MGDSGSGSIENGSVVRKGEEAEFGSDEDKNEPTSSGGG
jgi:hypothetical protein